MTTDALPPSQSGDASSAGESGNECLNKLKWELFWLSFISLFVELLIIRWMSMDIRAFAVFRTFPLVTCFVGLGIGCALARDRLVRFIPLTFLYLVAVIKVPDLMDLGQTLFFPSAAVNVHWIGAEVLGPNFWPYMLSFMLIIVLLLSGPFLLMVTIGARLGSLFEKMPPLIAYSINVGAAIVGSISFSALSFVGAAPWQLLVMSLAILVYLYWLKERRFAPWSWAAMAASVAIALAPIPVKPLGTTQLGDLGPNTTYYSPYQRLDAVPDYTTITRNGKEEKVNIGLHIFSNRLEYQVAADISGASFKMEELPAIVRERLNAYGRGYTLPFRIKPPREVLIVGAGSGNDVAEALLNGATHVDAVDIDPVIIKLGKMHNPRKPYDDPRVTIFCDDARNYFNHCKKKYDLIVFSHLDSHVVTGQGASMRLDNYVYTKDSFEKVMKLLKPDGLMIASFGSWRDWFKNRLFHTIEAAVGYQPLALTDKRNDWYLPHTYYIAGDPVREGKISLPAKEADIFAIEPAEKFGPERVLTDDWPFIYVIPQPIDLPYLLVVAEVLLIALFVSRKVLFGPQDARSWQLFFMGAAFLLLELQSISRLGRLYGSSWLTSAVVINGVLIMILLANLIVLKKMDLFVRNQNALYGLLLGSLAASYFLPINATLEWGTNIGNLGYPIVTLVTVLPMFAAGMVFASSFSQVAHPSKALAFNLFGAVVGAMLEYLSNYIGINALVLIAGGLYVASFICFRFTVRETPRETTPSVAGSSA